MEIFQNKHLKTLNCISLNYELDCQIILSKPSANLELISFLALFMPEKLAISLEIYYLSRSFMGYNSVFGGPQKRVGRPIFQISKVHQICGQI